jgi:PAS domain S-box-containing protein
MTEREAMDALRGINRDITDEQEAAKALRLSEAKLKLGMAVAGLGLGAMDYLNDQIVLDETAAALFALPANASISRRDVHARFHPDDASSIAALVAAALDPTGSGFLSNEHRIVRPDGSVRWVAARKQVEFSPRGAGAARRATTGLLAVRDVTDRKIAEIALRQSEERFRSALSAGRLGTWETNLLEKTRTWSAEGMALFGLSLADGRGQVDGDNDEFLATLHPDDRHLQRHFSEQADLQDSFSAEYRIIRPDGTIRWLSGHGHVVARGPDGKAHHLVNIVADITDRKVAEEKVQISETRYRRLFEAAHDGVLLVDPVTRKIVDANPFMTILLGYRHDQLVGKELFEIGLLKDEAASQDMFLKLNQTHQVRYEDLPLESQDGRKHEVEVVANLYDEGGHSIIQCNIRDITERKKSEILSRQNAALFTTLIEQAPTGVYVIDSQFRMQQVNALALPVFNAVRPLIGRDFSEVLQIIWGPDLGDQIAHIFRHTLMSGERYISQPFRELREDLGVMQSYEWEIQRAILADGQYGVVCYFNDVTERKLAENEVVEREAHVRSILDNTVAFVGLLDLDGVLLEANAPALAAAGLARKDVLGRKLWDTDWWSKDAAEVARLKDSVARAANGEAVRFDVVLRMAGDTRMDVDFMLAPVRDADGAVTMLVPSGLDITDRKRALTRVEFLMGEVNHRSMNLLGVVLAIARQMARGGDPATFVARLTDRISGLAASQDLLVQNQLEGVALPELIEAQLAHFKDLFGRRVLIDGPPARLTSGAAQGIGMALHELATNASKYGSLSTSHGRVRISWHITDAKEPRFTMHWVEENGPKIASPTRMGFGQKVIGPMVEAAVNGNTETNYSESGFSWKLTAPVTDTLEGGRGNSFTSPDNG